MKNLSTLFFAIVIVAFACNNILFAQNAPSDDRVWSRIKIDPNAPSKVEWPKWSPAPQVPRYFNFGDGITVDPNFRPHPTTNTTQSEMSVDVHPSDNNIVFGSANASNWPVTTIYGTGVYWSLDGGGAWTGFDQPPFGTNGGDPASVIGANGVYYEAYLGGGSYNCGIAVSTNNGSNWTTHIAYGVSNQDKEHIMIDKLASSPYSNRLYYTWSDLNGGEAALVYSTDQGTTWSGYKNLSSTITPLGSAFAQGPNVQTGPNGEVYVAYAIYDANWTDGEDAIGFSKSTDGGNTWTAMRIQDHVNFGIRGTLSSKGGIRVNSFPSMAVDKSGGSHNGYIYVCWPQRNFAPAGSDPDVCMIKSTDGGATWSPVIRVNDDPMNNGKDQIFPWITVDQATGQLMLVFYDSRNVANNMAEVYMATSLDGGSTFSEFAVSDQSFVFGPISGFAGGYGGDYIGVAAYDDVAYAFWMDSRTGNSQGWMSKVSFGPPCPVGPATNPNPPNNATNLPLTGNTLSWTNGAGANRVVVSFGQGSTLTQIYDGAPITSISLAPYEPFTYMTTYSWKVVEWNDSCNANSTVWAFTTMQDPNLVIDSVCVYPQSSNYWTGTCNSSTKTQVSLVNAVSNDVGWMVFDISAVPAISTILSVEFHGYLYNNAWPYWSITPMGSVNPITGTASAIYNQVSNNYQEGTAYSFNQESGALPTGWLTRSLGQGATTDLENQLGAGWFAMGFVDWDFSTSFYVDFQGWQEANKPYICIVYSYSIPVELTSFTASVVKDGVELKWNTATETNNQGFDVERMKSGGEFQKIGYVAGFGTTTDPKNYAFTDTKPEPGNYTYRLKQIDLDGTYKYSNEVNVDVTLPLEYSLDQNYPNPFNPSTTIKYSIAQDGFVKLSVYNMLGEEVSNLVNTQQKAGRYEINFNASNLASGVYIYRLETPNFTSSKKLMLMK